MINKTRLINLTRKLIGINSENPNGNEALIGIFVQNFLKQLGLKPKIYEFAPQRSNVICVLPGIGKGSLLITPHLDTVPAGHKWHYNPFKAKVEKGRLYGLGATDCKGNLAVSLEVINSLIEKKAALNYDLIFAATADEESGSALGLEPLLEKKILRPDQALVLDSDDFSIIVAQKGLLHIKIKMEGKRAHGAYPWLGVNAIDAALAAIKEIQGYRFKVTKNNFLKGPTINVGTINGGDKVNVVADWCEFELDIRFLPGEDPDKILKNIESIVKRNCAKYKIDLEGIQEPFSIAAKHALVKSLVRAMKKNRIEPRLEGSEGATTISFFQKNGIPSVVTGFGATGCAHITDEYVEINNLYKGALVLEEFLRGHTVLGA